MDDTQTQAVKDALGLLMAVERNDAGAVGIILAGYEADGPEARSALLAALIAHAVSITRLAASALEAEPSRILASVALSLAAS